MSFPPSSTSSVSFFAFLILPLYLVLPASLSLSHAQDKEDIRVSLLDFHVFLLTLLHDFDIVQSLPLHSQLRFPFALFLFQIAPSLLLFHTSFPLLVSLSPLPIS